jgi:transposase
MSEGFLSPSDRAYFRLMMRRQINSAVHRRMNTLLLLDAGWSAARVADALFLDEETVKAHRDLYERKGREGIEVLAYTGCSSHLTPDQLSELKKEVRSNLYMSAKAIAAWVFDKFSITYTAHAMAKVLKREGFVYKLPKRVPAKSSEQAQSDFFKSTLSPLLDESKEGSPVYFVDATHAAYDAHAACGWILRGETRELKANHGRVRININGALNASTLEVIHKREERITSSAMIELFKKIEEAHPQAEKITVILDNARYNRSKDVNSYVCSSRIKPVYLPPYAPNLNLIERFWGYLKKIAIWNRYYSTFKDFEHAVDGFFQNIGAHKEALERLLTPRFHFIGKP